MKTVIIRSIVASSALALLVAPLAYAVSPANQLAVINGAAFLIGKQAADGHIGAGASETGWSAVALAAAGKDLSTVKTSGGTSLRAHLSANPPGASATATDWERSILAITADHQNPYDFGGIDYVAKLKTFASANQLGSATASNDDIFGLMALLAAGVNTSDAVLTGELAYVLAHQRADGGFSYTTDTATNSDVDDTAAAIMALRAAQNAGLGSPAVTDALADAKAYMLATQNTDGGFPYDPLNPPEWGGATSNVSSTSWVLMALNSLGLSDSVDGTEAQAFLRAQQQPDGSFPYQLPLFAPATTGDVFDTAPAVTALAGGKYPLSIFSAPTIDDLTSTPTPSPTAAPGTSPVSVPASPSPAASASPTPTPAGAVLGDTATPTTASGIGNVLGSSVLPAVGQVSNLLLLALALAFAVGTGVAVRLRLAHARRRD